MNTRTATIKIEVPTIKKEESKSGSQRFYVTFPVNFTIMQMEERIKTYMTSAKKVGAIEGSNRWDTAQWLIDELVKFKLAEAAGVKTLPEKVK